MVIVFLIIRQRAQNPVGIFIMQRKKRTEISIARRNDQLVIFNIPFNEGIRYKKFIFIRTSFERKIQLMPYQTFSAIASHQVVSFDHDRFSILQSLYFYP